MITKFLTWLAGSSCDEDDKEIPLVFCKECGERLTTIVYREEKFCKNSGIKIGTEFGLECPNRGFLSLDHSYVSRFKSGGEL